jgi:ATP-dependent Clp protease adaptor protein ClpS
MPQSVVTTETGADELAGTLVEDMYQVVLFNDDHNTADFVVKVLMRVFGHPMELAGKIMIEAHNNGRSIADVEARESAIKHKQQLESYGLTAAVEPVH